MNMLSVGWQSVSWCVEISALPFWAYGVIGVDRYKPACSH